MTATLEKAIVQFDNRHQPTRCIVQAPLGFACYEGTLSDADTFEGTHIGVVQRLDDAEKWLQGEDVALQQIYDVPATAQE